MIRIMQSNQSSTAINSALVADIAQQANLNLPTSSATDPSTHQLLQLHQRQLNSVGYPISSPIHQHQQQQHPRALSAASTPLHSRLPQSPNILDYIRRSHSPSTGLNVSHADILHANLISDTAASSPSASHSKSYSLNAPLSIFEKRDSSFVPVGGSLHLNQVRQLQQQLRQQQQHNTQRSCTPTAELMRPGAGQMTLPPSFALSPHHPHSHHQQERRDSAPGGILVASRMPPSPGAT